MKQQLATLQAQVKAWNDFHAIGCEVDVTRDNGRVEHTKTRSAAWVLSGHSAVIMVEGISGAYLLDRVKRATPQEEPRRRESGDDSAFIASMAGAIPSLASPAKEEPTPAPFVGGGGESGGAGASGSWDEPSRESTPSVDSSSSDSSSSPDSSSSSDSSSSGGSGE